MTLLSNSAAVAPSVASTSALVSGTHDDSNYSSAGTNSRGNVTKEVQINNDGTSAATVYSYDVTGQVTSTTDPRSHVTQFSYVDAYASESSGPLAQTNAYVTSITRPATSGTQHQESYTYRYLDGQLKTATDENGKTTTYEYADSLNRPTDVIYPADPNNGNQSRHVSTSYNDLSLPVSVTTTSTASPDPNVVRVRTFDGIGNLKQEQISSDPAGNYVNITYDGEGNRYTVSNPSNSSSSSDGLTTYTYDALGRISNIARPSGTVNWQYQGPTATFTDENGHAWQRTSDGLGRLVKVVEPGGLTTTYSYNLSDNLLCVDQWGSSTPGASCSSSHLRQFTYDALSRLITAYNPETGTICYGLWSSDGKCINGYDPNGNLIAKSDGRGTISYSYDELNRITSKTVTQPNLAVTPSTCYQYDVGSASGNFRGRLTSIWTKYGACGTEPSSGIVTLRKVLGYDVMGRITREEQCHLSQCSTGAPYHNTMQYDLAGNLTYYGNRFQSIGLNERYDGAGRLTSVMSSLFDSTHPSTLFSVQSYKPFGGLENYTIGTVINVNKTYNNMLRVTGLTATHP